MDHCLLNTGQEIKYGMVEVGFPRPNLSFIFLSKVTALRYKEGRSDSILFPCKYHSLCNIAKTFFIYYVYSAI